MAESDAVSRNWDPYNAWDTFTYKPASNACRILAQTAAFLDLPEEVTSVCYYFSASDCEPCQLLTQRLLRLHSAIETAGSRIVYVPEYILEETKGSAKDQEYVEQMLWPRLNHKKHKRLIPQIRELWKTGTEVPQIVQISSPTAEIMRTDLALVFSRLKKHNVHAALRPGQTVT
jgi:hypothetical protein